MLHLSRPRSRFGLASAAVIALLVLSTSSVAAATGPAPVNGSFSQDGKSADAASDGCVSNGGGTSTCSSVSISIFVGKRSDTASGMTRVSQVCVNVSRYTVDATGDIVGEPVSEGGCRDDLSSRAIRIVDKLKSVTLAATTISIGQEVCDKSADPITCTQGPTHNVKVAGTWTGVGAITFLKYSSVVDDGTCRYTSAETSNTRGASFAGTVDGVSLAQGFASIADGKSSSSTRCRKV